MHWSAENNAGFTSAEPWLPLAEDFRSENVENQRQDPASILNLHRRLIALRHVRPALTVGAYRPLHAQSDLLLYRREHAGDQVTIALNLGREPTTVLLDAMPPGARVLLSSNADRDGEKIEREIDLRGNEGLVIGAVSSTERSDGGG
jgi:alpha-glucosidase